MPISHWDDVNTAHVAEHGLTTEEVDSVLRQRPHAVETSEATGRPCKFGTTVTGRHIVVFWDEIDPETDLIYPVTAYEVPRTRRPIRRHAR